jgi:hypothetical protein
MLLDSKRRCQCKNLVNYQMKDTPGNRFDPRSRLYFEFPPRRDDDRVHILAIFGITHVVVGDVTVSLITLGSKSIMHCMCDVSNGSLQIRQTCR